MLLREYMDKNMSFQWHRQGLTSNGAQLLFLTIRFRLVFEFRKCKQLLYVPFLDSEILIFHITALNQSSRELYLISKPVGNNFVSRSMIKPIVTVCNGTCLDEDYMLSKSYMLGCMV